jgi:excinuclease ABC subunit B
MPKDEIKRLLAELDNQMKIASKNLEFERAAVLRDQIYDLRALLADASNLPPWQKAKMLSGEID